MFSKSISSRVSYFRVSCRLFAPFSYTCVDGGSSSSFSHSLSKHLPSSRSSSSAPARSSSPTSKTFSYLQRSDPPITPHSNTQPSGLFAVYKPAGMTSASAVRMVKKLLGKHSKVGHGGTLDMAAEGVLVIGVGQGCRVLGSYTSATKEYITQATLGVSTDTYDIDGEENQCLPAEHVTREKVQVALQAFTGDFCQRPPAFSALKVNGTARSNLLREHKANGHVLTSTEEFRPPPRAVVVYSLSLLEFHSSMSVSSSQQSSQQSSQPNSLSSSSHSSSSHSSSSHSSSSHSSFSQFALVQNPMADAFHDKHANLPVVRMHIVCSAGFYVRSLCHDLGAALQTCGTMSSLVRSRVGEFVLADALQIGDLNKDKLMEVLKQSRGISQEDLTQARTVSREHSVLRTPEVRKQEMNVRKQASSSRVENTRAGKKS